MSSKFVTFGMKRILNILIPILFSITFYGFVGPVFLLFVIYRQFVLLISKLIRPDLKAFEIGGDAVYTTENPQVSVFNITICLVIDKEISPQRIIKFFEDRVFPLKDKNGEKIYQKLTQYWTGFMGYTFWAQDRNFSLQNHVRIYNYAEVLQLPVPIDMSALEGVLPKLAKLPWKRDQSHWEVLVVPNFSHEMGQSGRKTLVIFRIDHSLCDGYSLLGLCRHLFRTPLTMPSLSRHNNVLTPAQVFKILLTLPYVALRPLFSYSPEANHFGVPMSTDSYCDITDKFQNGRIKALKDGFGVAHASIMQSAVTAAIGKVFKDIRRTPPNTIAMMSTFPLPDHPEGLCNYGASCELDLPCNSESPVNRILSTNALIMEAGRNLRNFNMHYCIQLISLLPRRLARNIAFNCSEGTRSIDFTAFPCTSTREFVDGGEIIDALFTVNPNCGMGMLISSWGVNNQQRVVFNAVDNVFGSQIPAGILSTKFFEELDVIERTLSSLMSDEETK